MEEDLRTIVLVGVTGDGKSSTGNTLSSQPAFEVSAGLSSETSKCAHVDYLDVGDGLPQFYRVVDTIGLHDTNLPADEVVDRFNTFSDSTPLGIDVFCFVVRWGRFKPEHEAALSAFAANCGDAALEHTILVFTHCAAAQADVDRAIAETAPSSLRALLPALGGGVIGIDNVADEAGARLRLHAAVRALVDQNGGQRYANEALVAARRRFDNRREAERAEFAAAVADWRKSSGPVTIVRECSGDVSDDGSDEMEEGDGLVEGEGEEVGGMSRLAETTAKLELGSTA